MEFALRSTLDLLDIEDREVDVESRYLRDELEAYEDPAAADDDQLRAPQRRPATARELFAIRGEATGTSRLTPSKTRDLSKKRPSSATSTKRTGGNQTGNQTSHGPRLERAGSTARQEVQQEEVQSLRDQLAQLRRELEHTRDERDEVQVAFRRLDQEIVSGYNLTERKEKEMKIGELITKNQKMLEKELKTQETLRASNADLHSQVYSLQQQATLVNQVLSSVESKCVALAQANDQLTTSHAAAQHRIVSLHDELTQIRSQTIDISRNTDYEEKIRLWEIKHREQQNKLDATTAMLRAEQERVSALEQTIENVLEEKAGLEKEVSSVHDKMIQMNGALKTMEASVEANVPRGENLVSMHDKMKQRVRALEEELVAKNRLIGDLKESIDAMITGEPMVVIPGKGLKRRPSTGGVSRSGAAVANRVVALTQRLRKTEESRPQEPMSGRVDGRASSTSPATGRSSGQVPRRGRVQHNPVLCGGTTAISEPRRRRRRAYHHQPAVALARERYLLSGPYQPELLMGFTLSRAFSEVALSSNPPRTKHAKFMPFQVRTLARTSASEATNCHAKPQLVIVADSDDASGAAFLNRSKINAFLHFLQGKAAQAKAKPLLMQKIADLLTAQRELLLQHSTESGFYKALLAKEEVEIQQLRQKLQLLQTELDHAITRVDSVGTMRPNKLVLKLIEAIVDSSRPMQQHTFLTQTDGASSSDVLVCGDQSMKATTVVDVDLADSTIGDEDLEPLLLKLSVSGVCINELDLGDNRISDDGAATLAAYFETSALDVRLVNLRGNNQITHEGAARLQAALMKNPRVHRVDVDAKRHVLLAIAPEIDTAGRPLVLLQVRLPGQAFQNYESEKAQEESVQKMIQRLDSMGYCDRVSRLSRAEAVYTQPRRSHDKTATVPKPKPLRRASVKTTKSVVAVPQTRGMRPHQSQQEKRYRALEAAIRRADEIASTSTAPSERRGVSLTQMQYLLTNRNGTSGGGGGGGGAFSSHRMSKLQFAQSHLAMVRRLSKTSHPANK